MKTVKLIISVALCALLLASLIPASFAADGDAAVIYADDAEFGLGEKIEVEIKVENVPQGGMTSALVGVAFDKRLTFERSLSSFSSGLKGQKAIGTKNIDGGDFFERRFMWVDDGDGVSGDFTLAKAVFTVPAGIEPNTVFDFELHLSSDPKNYLNSERNPISVESRSFSVAVRDYESELPLSVASVETGLYSVGIPVRLSNLVAVRTGVAQIAFDLSWEGAATLSAVSVETGTARIGNNGRGAATVSWSAKEPFTGEYLEFNCLFDLSGCADGYESAITAALPANAVVSAAGADETGRVTLSPGFVAIRDHFVVFVPASDAGCDVNGCLDHYKCEKCGMVFSDPEGTETIPESEVTIPMLGHELDHFGAVEPTPEENGNIEYWKCSRCLRYFLDAEAKHETDESAVVCVFAPGIADVNADGAVNAKDVILILHCLTGWSADNYPALASFRADLADVNGDGAFNARDAIEAAKLIVGTSGTLSLPDVVGSYGAEKAPAVMVNAELPASPAGDVNGDGRLNAKDVSVLMKAIVSPDAPPKTCIADNADVNADGRVNAKDVSTLMKRLVGSIPSEPSLDTGVDVTGYPKSYNDFLSGTVFCGDSICRAIEGYRFLPDNNVLAANGAGIYSILDPDRFTFDVDGESLAFLDAIGTLAPKNVVLWLGINDSGYPPRSFASGYRALIDAVKKAAPKAKLYIMSITPIGPGTVLEDYGVTNESVDALNEALRALAGEYGIQFVDVSTMLKGEDNMLREDYAAYDGLHLPEQAYPPILKAFLDAVVGEG